MNVRDAYIVSYGRSPFCKAFKGSFANMHPVDFGAITLNGVLNKIPQLDPLDIDDVIVGCAMPKASQEANLARLIVQRAGLPDRVPAMTVNRFCSSGIQTIALAANAVMCGQSEIVVAGGVETMSLVSMTHDPESENPYLREHYPEAYMPMGLTAEKVAEQYGIRREEMDQMAFCSHKKALAAQMAGFFDDQIIPVCTGGLNKPVVIASKDEGIRSNISLEDLSKLKPCFKDNGLVTAGTSSQMADGAAFVVVMSKEKMNRMGLKPIAKFVGFAVEGVPADVMGIGPVKAVPKLMRLIGLRLQDMDVIELNEAFASQALACIKLLGMDISKVNPDGGAMALGHPLGATGTMLTCKALSYLRRNDGRYAMITMCIGGGMGAAAILENCCSKDS